MQATDQPRLPEPSRGYQFVTVGFGVLIAVLLLVFVVRQWVQTSKLVNPAEDFTTYLNSHGQVAAEPAVNTGLSLPAGTIYKINVNNQTVWLCVFDRKVSAEKQALESLHDKPKIDVEGKSRPVDVQNSMALVGYDGRPDEKEIVRLFDEFAKAPR